MNLSEAFALGAKMGRRQMAHIMAKSFEADLYVIQELLKVADALPTPELVYQGRKISASQIEEALQKGSEHVSDSPTNS